MKSTLIDIFKNNELKKLSKQYKFRIKNVKPWTTTNTIVKNIFDSKIEKK